VNPSIVINIIWGVGGTVTLSFLAYALLAARKKL
jgi:hypothetical protein